MSIIEAIRIRTSNWKWCLEAYLASRFDFLKKANVPNIVISTGGTASTMLLDYLNLFIDVNSARDYDHLKHMPYPTPVLHGKVVMFVYADPETVAKSLIKQKAVKVQLLKLQCFLCAFLWGKLRYKTLVSRIRKQIKAFKEYDSNTIFCIKYDDMWKRKEDIAKHFGIVDAAFIENFPKKKQRTSCLVPMLSDMD